MLKTNSKIVKQAMIAEVLNHYKKIEDLKADLQAVSQKHESVYNLALKLVRGGCFKCYNQDISDFLRDTLQETQQEADKYFDKSFDLYAHLIAKAIESLVK